MHFLSPHRTGSAGTPISEERTDRPGTKTWQSQVIGFPFTAQPYILVRFSTVKGVPQLKNVLEAKKRAGIPALLGGRLAGA